MKKVVYPDFAAPNCQPFFLEGGAHAVLLIHGFTGSPGHMRPLGDALHRAGFTVRGIRLSGHCETLEAMERSSWKEWLNDAETALHELQGRYETVSIGGLSMGGLICLRLAELHTVNAMLLFAPALRFRSWVSYLAPVAKYVLRRSPWRSAKHEEDPRFLMEYHIGYPGAPVAKVEDMMRLIRMTRPELSKINCPTLIAQSPYDESVHNSVPKTIYQGISSKVKEIHWLDQSPHVLTLGADRERLFRCCIDFLYKVSAEADKNLCRREKEASALKLEHDPVEHSAAYLAVIDDINKILEKEFPPDQQCLGLCHVVWNRKKQLLAEQGIHWRSPADMNPSVHFD